MNIDDDVLERAKRRAADQGQTLGELVTEALRERLARRPATRSDRYVAVTFGDGGTLPGIDLSNNAAVRDAMDEA
jgi:hypothetical protein